MAYTPIEYLLPKSGYSIYTLVRMTAVRAIELAEGKPRLIEKPSSQKLSTVAMEEVLHGKVTLKGHNLQECLEKEARDKKE